MSEFKGTPGPWVMEVVDGFNTVGVASAGGESICDMYHCVEGWTKPTSKQWKIDNARRIAAAPELLEALTNVLDGLGALTKRHELLSFMDEEDAEQVWAAIAKATGEHP